MEPPIRILAVVPEPNDASWSSAAGAAWRSIESALRAPIQGGGVEIVRLKPATSGALEDTLTRDAFHVVHVVGHGTSRPAARYGTLTLEGSDGRSRELNAQNFAKLCARQPHLELVVLQAIGGAPADMDVLRDAVVQHAASTVCAPIVPDAREAGDFACAFYSSLISGRSIEEAAAIAAHNPTALPESSAQAAGQPTVRVRESRAVPIRRDAAPPPPELPRARRDEPPPVTDVVDERARQAQRTLERKRAAGAFDVFLCHNVGDKPAVMEIGRRLMQGGVLPWLDQWELRPGTPWQRVLEEQIAHIQAAAVFVGSEGIGPWQRQELDGFLREFNKRGCPVIPVLLPGAAGEPELPLFLRGMTWVDFRVADPDPLRRLIWGITGQRPDRM